MDWTVGRPFWFALIQGVILIFFTILLYFFLVIFIMALGAAGSSVFMIIVVLALIYPFVATLFRVHTVVIEDRGPWHGMIGSIALANSGFFRVLGVVLIMAAAFTAISFATGLAMGTDPAAMTSSPAGDDPKENLKVFKKMLESYTWGTIVVNSIITALGSLFFFYILTPLYADLRARRGDFLPQSDEEYD